MVLDWNRPWLRWLAKQNDQYLKWFLGFDCSRAKKAMVGLRVLLGSNGSGDDDNNGMMILEAAAAV